LRAFSLTKSFKNGSKYVDLCSKEEVFSIFNFFFEFSTKFMTLLSWLGRVHTQSTPFASFPLKQPAPLFLPFFLKQSVKKYFFIPINTTIFI